MASGQVHVGDIGTAFRMTVRDEDNAAVDLSSASSLTMLFTKPSRTLLTKAASRVGSGADGRMQYVTQSGDLDEDGRWRWQGLIEVSGTRFYTDIQTTRVWPNLD